MSTDTMKCAWCKKQFSGLGVLLARVGYACPTCADEVKSNYDRFAHFPVEKLQRVPQSGHLYSWTINVERVRTPVVLHVPIGEQWIVVEASAPGDEALASDRCGLVRLTIEPGAQQVQHADGTKKVVDAIPEVSEVSYAVLVRSGRRLVEIESKAAVSQAKNLIDFLDAKIREAPTAEGVAALEAALRMATVAWAAYHKEVVPVISGMPLDLRSTSELPRSLRVEHQTVLHGINGVRLPRGEELPSVAVDLVIYKCRRGPEFTI